MLNLQYCNTLRKLPRNIGKLGSLKTLIISGCNIGEFPSEMRNMQSLEVLTAERIIINPLRTSNEEVKWWERIVWPINGSNTKESSRDYMGFFTSNTKERLLAHREQSVDPNTVHD
ncbi:hypothetical protein LguiA_008148 [Lonicera macranthoides]